MAATTCPSCGNVNPLGTERCVKCGTVLPASSRTVVCPNCKNVNPMGTAQCAKCGAMLPMDYLKPTVIKEGAEKKGLSHLKLAGLALIVTGLMIYIVPIAVWAWYGYSLPTITCCPPPSNIVVPPVPHNLVLTVQVIALLGVLAAAVAWILFGTAFRSLSEVDPSFRVASISAFIGILSVVLVGAAIGYDITAVSNYLNCLSATPGNVQCGVDLTNASYTIYWLWAFSIMFLIFGGIGVLIGLFRVGARYLTATFWIAGFLLIFPILLLIGAILLAFGAMGAEKRLNEWIAAKSDSSKAATTS